MVKVVKPSPKPQKASVVRKRPAAPAPQGHQSVPATTPATLDGSAEKPDWYGEANATVQNEVFLVTAAKLVNEEDPFRLL